MEDLYLVLPLIPAVAAYVLLVALLRGEHKLARRETERAKFWQESSEHRKALLEKALAGWKKTVDDYEVMRRAVTGPPATIMHCPQCGQLRGHGHECPTRPQP